MNLSYKIEKENNKTTTFFLKGKIMTTEDTVEINIELEELIKQNMLHLIFSLKDLDYINSTGLNFIISSFTKMRNAGGELVITSLSKKVEELLVITKLNTIFTSFETIEEAKKSFEEKKIIKN